MKVRMVVTIAGILLASSAWAQEPPSWINLGDLNGANYVRDIIELPSYGTILACGGSGENVWKTVDGGVSWSLKLMGTAPVLSLMHDSTTGRIWAITSTWSDPLRYSDNIGESWAPLAGPNTNPMITGQTIELLGNYLYFGGSVSSEYSISLYRLDTADLTWGHVTQYPQCNSITKLKVHNGNLLVFAKDKTTSVIRVFSYTPSELDAKATPVGKAEVVPVEPVEPKR